MNQYWDAERAKRAIRDEYEKLWASGDLVSCIRVEMRVPDVFLSDGTVTPTMCLANSKELGDKTYSKMKCFTRYPNKMPIFFRVLL